MHYVLCLECLALYFLVCFLLLADPSLHCVGEKHAPLHPRTQHRFSCLSLLCVLYLFVVVVMVTYYFSCLFIFKRFYLCCCFWKSLEFSCISCLESWPIALSCVS